MALGIAAIASLASTGISAGVSFAQGLRDQKLAREAEREAAKAIAQAYGMLDVNAFENLSVPKQDIALARAATDARNQATIQAAQEQGQRGVAAVGGQISQAQAQQEQGLLAQSEKREADKQRLVATQEQENIKNIAGLKLSEAGGAQLAAGNLDDRAQKRFSQGQKGLVAGVTSALGAPGLYDGLFGQKTKKEQIQTDSAVDPGAVIDIEAPKETQKVQSPLGDPGLQGLGEDNITWNNPLGDGLKSKMSSNTSGGIASFDEVLKSPEEITAYQQFVLSIGGDLGTSKATGLPFGADGKVGPQSRAAGTSPTLNSWAEYGPLYLEYKNNK